MPSFLPRCLLGLTRLLLLTFATCPATAADLIPDGAQLEELWNDGEFTEGVAAAPDGTIYFSDIPRGDTPGRVLKFDPATGKTVVHCGDSGKSNGLMFDADGRLIAACGANVGRQALCEITSEGKVKVLVDRFDGKRFNSPNDLCIHPDGSIYFSDPRYVGPEPVELDHQSVYRFTPSDGKVQRLMTGVTKPNGVIISPDGNTLYVAETDNGMLNASEPPPSDLKRRMTLNAFPLNAGGMPGERRKLVDFGDQLGIDGMTVDVEGNLYAALRSDDRHGILTLAADGTERGFLATDELPTNCCFGRGDEAATLYATIGGGLYRIRLNVNGYHLPLRSN